MTTETKVNVETTGDDNQNVNETTRAAQRAAQSILDAANPPKRHWAVTTAIYLGGALGVSAVGLFSYRLGHRKGYEAGFMDRDSQMAAQVAETAQLAINNAATTARNATRAAQ